MRRKWIQCLECHKLIPAEEYDAHIGRLTPNETHAVMGDIEEFVSPVDGSVVGSRSDLREHNAKHNVVSVAEYEGVVDKGAMQRRHDHYQGRISRKEQFKRRQEIHEIIHHLERQ